MYKINQKSLHVLIVYDGLDIQTNYVKCTHSGLQVELLPKMPNQLLHFVMILMDALEIHKYLLTKSGT